MVEANQPTHTNAGQRRMVRDGLRRDLWYSRILRSGAVLARRVSFTTTHFRRSA